MRKRTITNGKNATIAFLLGLLIITYFLFAFYPFELALPSRVANGATQSYSGAIRFSSPGYALLSEHWRDHSSVPDTFSVALEIRAAEQDHRYLGPSRILSFSLNPFRRNFTIAQDMGNLVLRVRRPGSDLDGTPNLVIRDVFRASAPLRIETRVTTDQISVSVNGIESLQKPVESSPFANWNWAYPIILGNERTGDRPWIGIIEKLEICSNDRCLDGLDGNYLTVPADFWEGDWDTLLDESQLFASEPSDVLVNIVGFVPFGVLMAWLRRPPFSLTYVLFAASTLSLTIELLQLLFIDRYTSFVDLALNVSGACVGYVIGKRLLNRRFSRR